LIEALMAGTPIVGYDLPCPRDLPSDHADPLLVPLGDTVALADVIARLACRSPVNRKLVVGCREYRVTLFGRCRVCAPQFVV
jgi:glycosyltransferase involved in cell wall biosynthesis